MSLVTVILPVYNAQDYIQEAVQSILRQTFKDFELIVINDGSTDDSLAILNILAEQDDRIHLISRENRGLISTLNEAIGLSNSEYIARMDADDIAVSTRLEKQVEFLKRNQDVAVVGTGYKYIDENGLEKGSRNIFTAHDDIVASFYFCNPIAHPSVMINYKLLGDNYVYNENFKTVEDIELWVRLSRIYKIANISEELLLYRVLESSISGENLEQQTESAAKMLSIFNDQVSDDIFKETYSYTVNSSSFFRFLRAVIKLNIVNCRTARVKRLALIKRTLIAILLWRKKNIRKNS